MTFALLILGVFGAVHLTLYARLKAGHITSTQAQTGWVRAYQGHPPALLMLEGDFNVTLTPADSFFVEVQEEAADKVGCRPLGQDSVIVKSDNFDTKNPHSYFQAYGDRPWITVHAPSHTAIRVKGMLALIRGGKQPGGVNLKIQAIDTQLWLGEFYGIDGEAYPTYYFDAVQVQAVNSKVVLHKNAVIDKLSVGLDSLSEISDQQTNIGTINLQYTPESKINLTGANLDKLNKTGQ